MVELLIFTRVTHYASMILLAGIFGFLSVVAEPAFRRANQGMQPAAITFRSHVMTLAWGSLAVALASGLGWLVLQAQEMSTLPIARVLSGGTLGTVLTRTQFGRDWELRFVAAILLVGWLLLHSLRKGRRLTASAPLVPLLLASVLLVTLAWVGHATDSSGLAGVIHQSADATHLLAAGAWLGGLVPLALLFHRTRRADGAAWAPAASVATLRFSTLGIICVGALLVTGIVNTWFLAGTIPALVGTEYGRLLLIKVGLFGLMVSVAAFNRLRLTPCLVCRGSNSAGAASIALRSLQRNSLVEACLGLIVLAVVGALGILVPAEHTQPWWPFPFRLSTSVLSGRPEMLTEAITIGAVAIIGAVLLIVGAAKRTFRAVSMPSGLILLIGAGGMTIRPLSVEAYPTSFIESPVPFSTSSIMSGAHLYAGQCADCHGTTGRGDGPAVKAMKVLPADLTTGYLLAQSDGDLFWWISHGRANGTMPAFADVLDESQRWDLINFLQAQASRVRAITLTDAVTARADLRAPDFPFEGARGQQETLESQRGKDIVLLVFFSEPESRTRLQQLANDETYLERAGVRILAVSHGASTEPEESADERRQTFPFVVRASSDVLTAYALFDPKSGLGTPSGAHRHVEFLIDRAGYIRARWSPEDNSRWERTSDLLDQVWRLERLGTAPAAPGVHVH